MTARSDQTPAVISSCKSWHRKRKLTTVRTAPFLIFIIDVSTRIVKHRKALLSVGFCGILVCRKGALSSNAGGYAPPGFATSFFGTKWAWEGAFWSFSPDAHRVKGGCHMTLAEVFALLAFIVSLLLTIMWTTPFLIFIIDVSTRIVKRGSRTIMAITTKRNDRP